MNTMIYAPGGPLLDSHGRLIGMNTMIYAPGGIGANVGIGFAIPGDTISRYVNQIIKFGPNARPSLGVSVLPDQIRQQYAQNLRRPLSSSPHASASVLAFFWVT